MSKRQKHRAKSIRKLFVPSKMTRLLRLVCEFFEMFEDHFLYRYCKPKMWSQNEYSNVSSPIRYDINTHNWTKYKIQIKFMFGEKFIVSSNLFIIGIVWYKRLLALRFFSHKHNLEIVTEFQVWFKNMSFENKIDRC